MVLEILEFKTQKLGIRTDVRGNLANAEFTEPL